MNSFISLGLFVFLGFFLLGTNASYSQTDSFDEMNYSQFLDFCHQYNPALWNSMSIEERLLSNLCDFVSKSFGEKQWNWLNGAKFDWKTFAQSAAEDYVYKIPEFVDGGIKETLRIDSFVSGRDSFPPPMMAIMSFDYEKLSQVIHYNEKFTVCIDGKLVPQDSFIECSDEYVKYNFTKEESPIIPKFVKPIPLPDHTRQQMLGWCQNSPKWAKIDKQFWDVVPTRILSTIPEFESLKGQTNSVVVNSYASEDTCPPNVWMVGTFTSENGDKHKFSLYHDSDFFRYNIGEIQCKNGLVLITKSIDDSFVCVKSETKQKLIERGWAAKDGDNVLETERLWKSSSDWNSLKLVRNNESLYCSSANNKLADDCYSLEEIVFGNHHKKGEQGWKIYPGGAGWRLPENTTLTPIYKEVKFGMMPLDFDAMLNDKIFVDKCESHGGTWNTEYADCEGIWEICRVVGGIRISRDVMPTCTGDVCLDAKLIRNSCVFPYEN